MRTVSHTLARQHRCCAALFYSGDSLRFPAYNGNEMPSWYTIIFFRIRSRGIQTTMLATLFSVRGFAGLRGRGRGFPLWWCSILSQGGKAASPASASPWRTPTNRSRTRLFSALKSAVFRGSQQPLGAFPLEEPTRNFPLVCMN